MPRPFNSFGRIRRRSEQLFAEHGFDPLEAKIELAGILRGMVMNGVGEEDVSQLEVCALYLRCLDAITPYAYPRLKQVTWQLPDGRAPDEVQLEMVQKIAWRLGFRMEPLDDDLRPPQTRGNEAKQITHD
jgi:hypothetical protein